MTRLDFANLILDKIDTHKDELSAAFSASKSSISYFVLDDLLPLNLAEQIHQVFPKPSEMVLKKSLKEQKYVSAQMNLHHPLLEELLFAFQDPRIIKLIQSICNINEAVFADEQLYAGGVSLMAKNCFLNPHLDNSHDNERQRWRVLNLLYYTTPGWEKSYGGNLELWPNGVHGQPLELLSKYNRLVVMATHDASWHSVNEVLADQQRQCISNYYFSPKPLQNHEDFHVTLFRGRPNQKLRNALLNIDGKLRMGIRKLFKKGIRQNPHIYKK
ncbi:MAG: 2OG-Fe(II) oxygenase [Flavobacteriaceae bacterium]